jgi:hypothetical protein
VEVSADGKTLMDSFTTITPRKDGKQPTTVYFFNRIGGDGKPYPFLGVWKPDHKRTKWGEEAPRMIITESAGVLTLTNTSSESETTINLQKSEITVTGPNEAKDVTYTVKKIGERSFEWANTRRGITTKRVYEVSANGKTLSVRNSVPGEDGQPRSATTIYERQ